MCTLPYKRPLCNCWHFLNRLKKSSFSCQRGGVKEPGTTALTLPSKWDLEPAVVHPRSWGGRGELTVLLSASEALRLEGCEARVCIAGLVPLRLASRPAGCRRRLHWSRGLRGPRHHPGPLQGHVVVGGLPGRVARPFREIGDGDTHIAWRCGRWFPVPALLPSCREKAGCQVQDLLLHIRCRYKHPSDKPGRQAVLSKYSPGDFCLVV